MNDEQLGIEPDEGTAEVEGHKNMTVRDDTAGDTDDVEGHKNIFTREAPDDDDDVEGHRNYQGGRG